MNINNLFLIFFFINIEIYMENIYEKLKLMNENEKIKLEKSINLPYNDDSQNKKKGCC
jgi:hypothetical protein